MTFNPDVNHRRSIRLQHYDYAQAGAYFVTICVQHHLCLFGDIIDGNMILNDAGKMILQIWNELPDHYSGVDIDHFTVMPNHIHGIIVLVGAGPRACPTMTPGQPQGVAPTFSLSDVVQRYKSFTTAQYRYGVEQHRWPAFPGKLWQRNYYEHVIRNADDLNSIREYITYNPVRWADDEEHPEQRTER